ncbi:hypothetical protein ACO0R3_004097 [Hanseniaspora guilliermondii]
MKIIYCKAGCFLHPTKNLKDNINGYIIIYKSLDNFLYLGYIKKSSLTTSYVDYFDTLDLYFVKDSIIDQKPTRVDLNISGGIDFANKYLYYSFPFDSINLIHFRKPSKFYKGSILIKLLNSKEFVIFLHDDECESTKKIKQFKIKTQYNPFDNKNELYYGGEDLKRAIMKVTPMMREKNNENVYILNNKVSSFTSDLEKKDTGSFWNNLENTKWSLMAKFADLSVSLTSKETYKKNEKVKWVMNKIQEIAPEESKKFIIEQQRYLQHWAERFKNNSEQEGIIKLRKIEMTNDGKEFIYQTERDSVLDLNEIMDDEGYLKITMFELRSLFNFNNISNEIRIKMYPILLGVYDISSNELKRLQDDENMKLEYEKLSTKLNLSTGNDNFSGDGLDENSFQILKDVYRLSSMDPILANDEGEEEENWSLNNEHLISINRILLNLTQNHPTQYVQGMADIVSTIYLLYPSQEALVYNISLRMFDDLKLRENFREDQKGITHNLDILNILTDILMPSLMKKLKQIDAENFVYVYKMFLVLFTRENFKSHDLLKFWDYTIAGFRKYPQTWIVLGILYKYKKYIINQVSSFDDLFIFFNKLEIENADEILQISDWLYLKYFNTIKRFDMERLKWDVDNEADDPLGPTLRGILDQPID